MRQGPPASKTDKVRSQSRNPPGVNGKEQQGDVTDDFVFFDFQTLKSAVTSTAATHSPLE